MAVKRDGRFYRTGWREDTAQSLAALIREECDKANCQIERGAVELLIGKVNANTRLLVEEIRKLCTFVGSTDGTIDEAMINQLVPNFGEADFFEAADAFFSLKLDWTLEALRRHFFTNKDARGLFTASSRAIAYSFNYEFFWTRARFVLAAAGFPKVNWNRLQIPMVITSAVSEKSNLNVFTQNPWYLGRLAETARKVPLKKLVDFQIAFTKAFEAIIERPNDQEEVCRELAISCLGDK